MSTQAPTRLKIHSDAQFMKVLKQRVQESLGGRPGKDDPRVYIKSLIIFIWFAISYFLIFNLESNILKTLAVISTGISSAGLGFNIFHDAIHGSLSSSRKVNNIFSFISCSFVGPGHHFWKHKHNYLHHQFPNIQDWDDDLETREGLRLSPTQPMGIRYKYQHIYAPLMYALTSIEWFFMKDYVQYFTLKMNQWQGIPKLKISQHFEFWGARLLYYSFSVVVPLMYFDFSSFIIGFLFFHFSLSLTMAGIFQLAHVMSECDFPTPDKETGELDRGWALLQLSTTVNFAPSNQFITWFSGGLNYQVEHHIFPNISHSYYPQISPILEKTCKEFGYPYNSIPSYLDAVKSHFKVLKKLGYHAQPEVKLKQQLA